MLNDVEIATVVDRIVRELHPHRIVLFGSYAKGRQTPASDLDLLIVLDTPMGQQYRAALVAPLINDLSVRIDAHIATPAEVQALSGVRHSFMDSVIRTGRVLYDQDGDTT